MSETVGVDVAWTKPSAAAIKAAGYAFAIGYLSTDAGKNLTAAFVADCHAHAVAVGAVWETTSARALAGTGAGQVDGRSANTQAAALGIPTTVPLFFAVDTDTTPGRVADYFRGVSSTCAHPVGVYGSVAVVDGVLAAGLAVVGWQTCAWSAGKVSTRAHLYQRQAHTRPPIAGVDPASYDEDLLLASDLAGAGLWLPGQTPPAPTPAPAPVQEDDMAYLARAHGDGRWYAANLRTWEKRYVPSAEIAGALTFAGDCQSNKGQPFVWDPAVVAWLADVTPGGSPQPQPIAE